MVTLDKKLKIEKQKQLVTEFDSFQILTKFDNAIEKKIDCDVALFLEDQEQQVLHISLWTEEDYELVGNWTEEQAEDKALEVLNEMAL